MKNGPAPLAETMIPAVRYGKQQITLTEEAEQGEGLPQRNARPPGQS